jgi:hypothetical protein
MASLQTEEGTVKMEDGFELYRKTWKVDHDG